MVCATTSEFRWIVSIQVQQHGEWMTPFYRSVFNKFKMKWRERESEQGREEGTKRAGNCPVSYASTRCVTSMVGRRDQFEIQESYLLLPLQVRPIAAKNAKLCMTATCNEVLLALRRASPESQAGRNRRTDGRTDGRIEDYLLLSLSRL